MSAEIDTVDVVMEDVADGEPFEFSVPRSFFEWAEEESLRTGVPVEKVMIETYYEGMMHRSGAYDGPQPTLEPDSIAEGLGEYVEVEVSLGTSTLEWAKQVASCNDESVEELVGRALKDFAE